VHAAFADAHEVVVFSRSGSPTGTAEDLDEAVTARPQPLDREARSRFEGDVRVVVELAVLGRDPVSDGC
jgi:hypothetical protein